MTSAIEPVEQALESTESAEDATSREANPRSSRDRALAALGLARARDALVVLVNLITAIGLAVGLAGVVIASPVLLLLSSAFDVVDGFAARRLSADTLFGAKFDWTVDTALSYAIVYRVVGHWPIMAAACTAVLVITQSTAAYFAWRFSGRTIVTLLAAAWIWLPA
jgi:phosphatidylglycerophosphate synthase